MVPSDGSSWLFIFIPLLPGFTLVEVVTLVSIYLLAPNNHLYPGLFLVLLYLTGSACAWFWLSHDFKSKLAPAWHRSSAIHLLRACFLCWLIFPLLSASPRMNIWPSLFSLEKSFLHQSILCTHPPLLGLRWRRSGIRWALWCTCGTRPIFVAELGGWGAGGTSAVPVGLTGISESPSGPWSLRMGRIFADWDQRKCFGEKTQIWPMRREHMAYQKPAMWPKRRLDYKGHKSKVEEVNLFYWVTGHTVSF